MKRYFLTNETEESIKETMKTLKNPPKEKDQNGEEIKEDNIVDDSSFVMDKETVRQARLSGGDGAGQKGLYDNRKMSDLEIRLRDGKLDKADITQEQMKLQKEIKEKDSKKKQEELEAVRQKAIDNTIGVGQPEQEIPTKNKDK